MDSIFSFKIPGSLKPVRSTWSVEWTVEDDTNLLRGIYTYGMGSWDLIKMDKGLKLSDKILDSDLKKLPQSRHLQTRADGLLKNLQKLLDKYPQHIVNKAYAKPTAPAPKSPQKKSKHKPKQGSDKSLNTAAILTESSRHAASKKKPAKSMEYVATDSSDSDSDSKPLASALKKPSESSAKQNKKKSKSLKKGRHKVKSPKKENAKTGDPLVDADGGKKKSSSKPNKDKEPKDKYSLSQLQDDKSELFTECKTLMKPTKSAIRKLNAEEDPDEIRDCLLQIGNHIEACMDARGLISDKQRKRWSQFLWEFVSMLITDYEADEMQDCYHKFADTPKKGSDEATKKEKSHRKSHHHHHHHSSKHKKDKSLTDKKNDQKDGDAPSEWRKNSSVPKDAGISTSVGHEQATDEKLQHPEPGEIKDDGDSRDLHSRTEPNGSSPHEDAQNAETSNDAFNNAQFQSGKNRDREHFHRRSRSPGQDKDHRQRDSKRFENSFNKPANPDFYRKLHRRSERRSDSSWGQQQQSDYRRYRDDGHPSAGDRSYHHQDQQNDDSWRHRDDARSYNSAGQYNRYRGDSRDRDDSRHNNWRQRGPSSSYREDRYHRQNDSGYYGSAGGYPQTSVAGDPSVVVGYPGYPPQQPQMPYATVPAYDAPAVIAQSTSSSATYTGNSYDRTSVAYPSQSGPGAPPTSTYTQIRSHTGDGYVAGSKEQPADPRTSSHSNPVNNSAAHR